MLLRSSSCKRRTVEFDRSASELSRQEKQCSGLRHFEVSGRWSAPRRSAPCEPELRRGCTGSVARRAQCPPHASLRSALFRAPSSLPPVLQRPPLATSGASRGSSRPGRSLNPPQRRAKNTVRLRSVCPGGTTAGPCFPARREGSDRGGWPLRAFFVPIPIGHDRGRSLPISLALQQEKSCERNNLLRLVCPGVERRPPGTMFS